MKNLKGYIYIINTLLFIVIMLVSVNLTMNVWAEGTETDEEKIIGKWYTVNESGDTIAEYVFKTDETFTYLSKTMDGEIVYDETGFGFEFEAGRLTFKQDNSVAIADFKYEFDEEAIYLTNNETSSGIPVIINLYRNEELAKANSEAYKRSDNYLVDIADEEGFAIKDGVLLAYFGDSIEITIPENVHTISSYAFEKSVKRANSVSSVTIPGNVRVIEENAFQYSGVTLVIMEEGVETVGDNCFGGSELMEIYMPKSLINIGEGIADIYAYDSSLSVDDFNAQVEMHCVKGSTADVRFCKDARFKLLYDYEEAMKEIEQGEHTKAKLLYGFFLICVIITVVAVIYLTKKKRVISEAA